MTVQTEFVSWQEHPKQPDPHECSPLNSTLARYLIDRWGGADLGCYAVRPIVGGTSISSHASGAANDWRYQGPGPGREVLLNEVMPFLIDNSRELGVQALHDYAGDRIWRPPGCSGRPTTPSPLCGWRKQNGAGGQMGEAWATWIHVEVLPSRWDDTRTVGEMLGPTPMPEPEPEEDVMPNFIAKTSASPPVFYIGNGVSARRLKGEAENGSEDDDKAAQVIADFADSGYPLRDLKTGNVVNTLADVSEAGGITSRIGKPV